MWRRPSLAVAALPLAFAAGVALPHARLAPVVLTRVVTRPMPHVPDGGRLIDGYGSGQDDLDGDGTIDCWAMWWQEGSCCGGGELEVRPGCGDHAWRTDTSMSRYDHLQIVKVPTEAATLPLAKALWDLPVDAADSLTSFLIDTYARTPDPWAPATGAFGTPVDRVTLPVRGEPGGVATSRAHVAMLTPEEALARGLVDDIGDTRAVLVAHEDGGGEPAEVAECADLGESTVWQTGDHLAWKAYGGWWTWILASEGAWTIDEVACVGRDQVLVRETSGGDARVIAIDVGRGLRATLAGVDRFEYDDDDPTITLRATSRSAEVNVATLFARLRTRP